MKKYVLDANGVPRVEDDTFAWARWFAEPSNRRVAIAELPAHECIVSTVFLGYDTRFGRDEEPVLFETMVLGGRLHGRQRRARTRDEALTVHREVLREVLNAQNSTSDDL